MSMLVFWWCIPVSHARRVFAEFLQSGIHPRRPRDLADCTRVLHAGIDAPPFEIPSEDEQFFGGVTLCHGAVSVVNSIARWCSW